MPEDWEVGYGDDEKDPDSDDYGGDDDEGDDNW